MSEFINQINGIDSEPILRVDKGDAFTFLIEREMRLIAELRDVRLMLKKIQGFDPQLTYSIFFPEEIKNMYEEEE